jgi:hypothetical protein
MANEPRIVWESNFGNYFLRDDYEIRKGVPHFMPFEQAYSLFRKEPYGRVMVFAGSLEWAIKQARKAIEDDRNLDHSPDTGEARVDMIPEIRQ